MSTIKTKKIRILIIEDSVQDTALMVGELQYNDYEVFYERIDSENSMKKALSKSLWDIIISDHNLPQFNSLKALEILKQSGLDIPFIIVSGAIGEEVAVAAMKAGASDYVNKNKLIYLIPAIERGIKDVETRRAYREAEERFRIMADQAPVIITLIDETGHVTYTSKGWEKFTGRTYIPEKGVNNWIEVIHPDDLLDLRAQCVEVFNSRNTMQFKFRLLRSDAEYRWMQNTITPRFLADSSFAGYISSSVDVTDLNLAKKLAEEANKRKSEFLAMISHELRTPLNSIIGFSKMLEMQEVGPINEKQAKYIKKLNISGKHLLDIVNDLLDVSKIEAGVIMIFSEYSELLPIIEEVKSIVNELACTKNIQLFFEIQPDLEKMELDPARFKQILINLINNAIKFNKENGKVFIRLYNTEDKKWLIGEIEDTGIGIPEDKLSCLFNKFYQVDCSGCRNYGGTGLGLVLTKEFLKLHNGDIQVNSKEGIGSTFTFKIPVCSPALIQKRK